jgi:hypothetical protein
LEKIEEIFEENDFAVLDAGVSGFKAGAN